MKSAINERQRWIFANEETGEIVQFNKRMSLGHALHVAYTNSFFVGKRLNEFKIYSSWAELKQTYNGGY